MREVTKYIADDGREFGTAQECRIHEYAVRICEQVGPTIPAGATRDSLYRCTTAILDAGFNIVRLAPSGDL